MHLIVGLGNPGKEYSDTRHNSGFLAVEKLLKYFGELDAVVTEKKKADSIVNELAWQKEKIVLARPQTMMNNSGTAVKELVKIYKAPLGSLLVIHDEVDLRLGKIKLSHDASAGGHRGVQSIIDHLGSKQFARFRLGINAQSRKMATEEFVLKKFVKSEKPELEAVLEQVPAVILEVIHNGLAKAMSRYN